MSANSIVVVIEDDRQLSEYVAHILESSADEYTVELATTLRDGIAVVRRDEPCAVVLDLNLPNSVGLETLRKLLEAVPDAVVVILTGDGAHQGAEAIEMGAFAYISKPCDGKSLVERVRDAVALADRLRKMNEHYDIQRKGFRDLKQTISAMRN